MSPEAATSLEEEFLLKTDARIVELEDARQEYDRLVDLRQRLKGSGSSRPARPRNPGSNDGNGRSGSNGVNRKAQLFQLIQSNPGITAADAARQMGLKAPTYVYRLRDAAIKDGTLRVEDGKMFITEAAPAAV